MEKRGKVCLLIHPEEHSTGHYFAASAVSGGWQVDKQTTGRHVNDPANCDLLLYVEPGPVSFPFGIERVSGVRAAYLIDVHQDLSARLEMAPLFDLVFVAQRDYLPAFLCRGHSNVQWLPLACAPAIHNVPGLFRNIEVGFVGQLGAPRSRRYSILTGVLSKFRTNDYQRFYTPAQMGQIYSSSKIVFNASIKGDVNMRVFEAMAAGALLVTDRIANGLSELFEEGVHYVGYSTREEAIERIQFFLANPEERVRVAAAGQALVLAKHTYAHRWSAIESAARRLSVARRPPTGRASTDVTLNYARVFASRRDPVGICQLIGEAGFDMGLGACLVKAVGRFVNSRIPLTPGAIRARLRGR